MTQLARVIHFGPSVAHVGGMASVISTLVDESLGAPRASAVATWVPGSHARSGLLALKAAAGVLREPSSTAVHVHMSEGGSFVREAVVVAAASRRRLVTVITIHGPGFAEFAARRRRLVAAVLRQASTITVLSDIDLAAVRALAPSVPSELLPNPTRLSSTAGPVSETDEIVLFAGEIGLRKGVDVLAAAWPKVADRRPNARCIVVGPPTDLVVPAAPRMDVRGPVPPAEVQKLLDRARVVALPSRGEALPMILTEAMASGRPFVSTPTGGIPSLAVGGILVPVEDDERLADGLVELLADPAKAQELGSAGRAYCRQRMSPDAIDARLRAIYSRR